MSIGSHHRVVVHANGPSRPTAAAAAEPAFVAPDHARIGERLVARLLDGPHPWGALQVWTSHYGSTACCLVVYPPGATRADRVRFRALRAWPPVGMLLGLAVLLAVGRSLPLIVAFAAAAMTYSGGAVGLVILAGPSRRLIRTRQEWRDDLGPSRVDHTRGNGLDPFVERLQGAECSWRAGRLDAVQLEVVWGAVWRELGETSGGFA